MEMRTKQIAIIIITYLNIFSCKSSSYYELLGVEKDASKAEIRRAFKKIALEKHPDKNKVSEMTSYLALHKDRLVLVLLEVTCQFLMPRLWTKNRLHRK